MAADDYLVRIEKMVGTLYPGQRAEVLGACDDGEGDALIDLAERLLTADLDNPAGAFISALRKGQHLKPQRGGGKHLTTMPPRDAFGSFFAEYREWLMDRHNMPRAEAVERALDYAVCSMSTRSPIVDGSQIKVGTFDQGMTTLTLEDEIRDSIGIPRPHTIGEARTQMGRDWAMIAACLHDARIAAVHHELMRQCRIPFEPTHAEGNDCRAALIAEIMALNVRPGSLARATPVDGFVTVGAAVESTSKEPKP